ncbi:tRNA pseudouridine(55) synthase TruB [Microbacterium sp. CIAB417]|uniref:tRNA pseudouridine(55) synthase TruB n=1 Tax=Microbacterium sp. CIAB417 TaxID=2860287 RepID=UPI001FAB8FF9|nr:tRNA pseudouridine(55) synthase TruB [Microbacterium sp. CIAB417]
MAGDAAPTGVLLVDKPGGLTSHDVVSRTRRALNTRKVGHAGTLDPMATGLLVLGVGAATRLLTYVVGLDKTYETTILLGASTDTDDADGTVVHRTDAARLAAVTDEEIRAGVSALTGDIEQVPSTVSAIKVAGKRAYDLARAGEDVVLASRAVTVSRFEVLDIRRREGAIELDAVIDCSSGTYIRALARDLGAALAVGGHLTALRRTRIGAFDIASAVDLEHIGHQALWGPAAAAALALPTLTVRDDEARDLRHGKRLSGAASRVAATPVAAIGSDGALIGVLERRGADLKSAMNMPEEHS